MFIRARIALLLVAGVLAAAPAPAAPSGVERAAAGLIAESGGIYHDPALAAYVRRVGMRLVAAAGRAGEAWSFTVLDTPDTNAFELPGGRIFVTRGMLALADDGAELAAILGHEIGHAVAGDGLVGRSERDRRAAEFAADRRGMQFMAAAGYDPEAQADFLETLLADHALGARLRGGDPARAVAAARNDDHPALADRLRVARREAARFGAQTGARDRAGYLAAIDGMAWGDGPAQGFVRGRSFLHPDLGFAFTAPAGYALDNRPDAVVATGPGGAMLLLDSLPDPGGSPEAYLVRGWVPEIARGVRVAGVEGLRRTALNGLPAAQAQLDLAARSSTRVAELTVVRHGGRLYRLTGLHAPGDAAGAAALAAAAASFRSLPAAEAARIPPRRIRIHRIAAGENVAALADGMPVGAGSRAWFDLINGLRPGQGLRVGDAVKVVVE